MASLKAPFPYPPSGKYLQIAEPFIRELVKVNLKIKSYKFYESLPSDEFQVVT